MQEAVVAEWLRNLARNQIPSGSACLSSADREIKLILSHLYVLTYKYFSLKNKRQQVKNQTKRTN